MLCRHPIQSLVVASYEEGTVLFRFPLSLQLGYLYNHPLDKLQRLRFEM